MQRDIDQLIARLRLSFPEVAIEQLDVNHPGADDDGLWFVRHPRSKAEVQVESSTGALPFLVESDVGSTASATTIEEAFALVTGRLGLRAGTT